MADACPIFGSTSEVALFYAVEPAGAPASLAAETLTWYQVPMSGESIDAKLTSAVSDQITSNRSYAGSKLVQGEVSGSFNYEAQASNFIYDMLISVLQADKTLSAAGSSNWADGQAIKNGSTKHCLAFLKRVQVDATHWDWYVFRGCQVGSISLDIKPNALITGSVNLMGIKPDAALEAAVKPTGWTLTNAVEADLMSGVDSLQNFDIVSGGTSTGVTMQNFTMTLENQLRQQSGVGLGHPFSAGIASGRFKVTFSGQAYYQSPKLFNALLNDTTLGISGSLLDATDNGFSFEAARVKVTSGALPQASSPDQDLLISSEFQAFEDSSKGTISITKVVTP